MELITVLLGIWVIVSVFVTRQFAYLSTLVPALGVTIWSPTLEKHSKNTYERDLVLNVIRKIIPRYQRWSVDGPIHLNTLIACAVINTAVAALSVFNVINGWYTLLIVLMFALNLYAAMGTSLLYGRLKKVIAARDLVESMVEALNTSQEPDLVLSEEEQSNLIRLMDDIKIWANDKEVWDTLTTDDLPEQHEADEDE